MKVQILTYFILLISNIGLTQVSLSPELGLSYLPFTLYGANIEIKSNRVDYIFGISAQLPIHKYWYINSRLAYINREDIRWTDLCICPGYLYSEFRHYDFDIEMLVMRNLNKFLSFGVGPSLILKSEELEHYGDVFFEGNSIKGQNEFLISVNSMLSFKLPNDLILNFKYMKYLNEINYAYKIIGNNRLDFTIAYMIQTNKQNR